MGTSLPGRLASCLWGGYDDQGPAACSVSPASRRLLTRWSTTLVTRRVQLSLPTARVTTCMAVMSEGGRSPAGGTDNTASRAPSWRADNPTRDPAGAKRAAGGPPKTSRRGPSVPASAPAPPQTVTSQVAPRRWKATSLFHVSHVHGTLTA